MIAEQILVPKGTLHWWLRDIPYSPNQYARQKRKQGFANSAASRAAQAVERGTQARQEAQGLLGTISERDTLLAGIGLLLGRSPRAPRGALFRTTSPEVARFATRWFQDALDIAPEHLAPFIQISSEKNTKDALQYWAKETSIPPGQFTPPRIVASKTPTGSRSRDFGTFYLALRGCGKRHFKVDLEQRIQGFRDALLMGEGRE